MEGVFDSTKIVLMNAQSLASWTDTGLFWINCFLASITVTAVCINYFIFRSQVDPEIIVYSSSDETRSSIILLIIENIGKGMAKDIKFTLPKPIPAHAWGIDADSAKVPPNMTSGPLIDGIPALGPGAKRVITWGQFAGLTKGLGDNVVDIIATYKSGAKFVPWDRKHRSVSRIDVKSFEGTDDSEKNWGKQIVEQLKEIVKNLKNSWSSIFMDILTIALLILCGFVLLVIEAFLVPGFSVPGIAGIVLIFFGVYRALGEFGPTGAIVAFFCAVAGTAALVWVTMRTKAAKRASLEHSERGYTAPDDQTELIGKEGVSITPLRPAGTALIGGERVDVVTDGEFLERETPVRVSAVEGTRVIVTRIREK